MKYKWEKSSVYTHRYTSRGYYRLATVQLYPGGHTWSATIVDAAGQIIAATKCRNMEAGIRWAEGYIEEAEALS
jgi:hypothetical protein